MGWPLTETLGIQVPRSPLTNLRRELHLCRLPNEPPFLFAHLKPRLARGHAIFSPSGRGVKDVIVMTGGTQTCQERRATCEQYPPGTISATLCFEMG